MSDDEIAIGLIDWEQQSSEQVSVFYMAGPASKTVAFVPGTLAQGKPGPDGKPTDPTAKDRELADRQEGLMLALEPVLDTLRAIVPHAPTFRGKPVGAAGKLFRARISEGKVKTVQDGQIVEVPTYAVEAIFGEPSNPVVERIAGPELQEDLAETVAAARELAEAHLG